MSKESSLESWNNNFILRVHKNIYIDIYTSSFAKMVQIFQGALATIWAIQTRPEPDNPIKPFDDNPIPGPNRRSYQSVTGFHSQKPTPTGQVVGSHLQNPCNPNPTGAIKNPAKSWKNKLDPVRSRPDLARSRPDPAISGGI